MSCIRIPTVSYLSSLSVTRAFLGIVGAPKGPIRFLFFPLNNSGNLATLFELGLIIDSAKKRYGLFDKLLKANRQKIRINCYETIP